MQKGRTPRGAHKPTSVVFSDTRIRNCDFFVPTYTVSSALWAATSCLLEAGSRPLVADERG